MAWIHDTFGKLFGKKEAQEEDKEIDKEEEDTGGEELDEDADRNDEEGEDEDDEWEDEEEVRYSRKDKKEIDEALKAEKRKVQLPPRANTFVIDALISDLAEAQKGLKLIKGKHLNEVFVGKVADIQNKIIQELGPLFPGEAEIILQNISIDIDVKLTRGKLENRIYSTFNKLGDINIYNSRLAETLKNLPGAKTIEEYLPTLSRIAGRALNSRMVLTAGVIGVGGIVGGGLLATVLGTAAGAWAGYSGAKALYRAHKEREFNETMQELNDIEMRGLDIDDLSDKEQDELRKLRRKIVKAEGKGKEPKESDIDRRDELEAKATTEGFDIEQLDGDTVRWYANKLLVGAHRFEKAIALKADGSMDRWSVPAKLLIRLDQVQREEVAEMLESADGVVMAMSREIDKEIAGLRNKKVQSLFHKLRFEQYQEKVVAQAGGLVGGYASFAIRLFIMPFLKGQTITEGAIANLSPRIPTIQGIIGIEGAKEGSIVGSPEKNVEAAFDGLKKVVTGIPGVNYLVESQGPAIKEFVRGIPGVGRLVPEGEIVPMPAGRLTSEWVAQHGLPSVPEGKTYQYYSSKWLDEWNANHGGKMPENTPGVDEYIRIRGDYPKVPINKTATGETVAIKNGEPYYYSAKLVPSSEQPPAAGEPANPPDAAAEQPAAARPAQTGTGAEQPVSDQKPAAKPAQPAGKDREHAKPGAKQAAAPEQKVPPGQLSARQFDSNFEKKLGKGFSVTRVDGQMVVTAKIGGEGLLEQTENQEQALRVLLSRVYGDELAKEYGGTIPVRALNAIENVIQNIKDPAMVEEIVGEKIDLVSVDPSDPSGNTLRLVRYPYALNELLKHGMEVATSDAGGTNTSHDLWEQRLGHPVEDFKTGAKPTPVAPVHEHAQGRGAVGAHEKAVAHKTGGARGAKAVHEMIEGDEAHEAAQSRLITDDKIDEAVARGAKAVHEMVEGDEAHEAAQPRLITDDKIDEAVARGEGKILVEPGYDGRTSLADQYNALTSKDQDTALNDFSNRIERTGINVMTDIGDRLISLQGTLGERGLSGITDIKQAELTLLAKVLEGEASSHVLDTPADGGGGRVIWEHLPVHVKGSVLDVLGKLEKQGLFSVDGKKVSLAYNPLVLHDVWDKSIDLKHTALDHAAEKISPDAWKKAFSFAPIEKGVPHNLPVAPVDQPPVMRNDIGTPAQQRLMEERAQAVLQRAGVIPPEVPASGSTGGQAVGEVAVQNIVDQPLPAPSVSASESIAASIAEQPVRAGEGITAQAAEQPVQTPTKVEPVTGKITAQAVDTGQKITGSAVSEEAAKAMKSSAVAEQAVPKLSVEEVAKQAYQHVLDVLEKQHGINPHLVDYTNGLKVSDFLEKMQDVAAGKSTPKDIFGLGADQYSNKEYQTLVKYITDHAPTKAEKAMLLKDYLPSKEK